MRRTVTGAPFLIIGENIHATRTLSRSGRHVVDDGDGVVVAFTTANGTSSHMPIASPVPAGAEFASGRLKHLRNALLLGLAADGVVGTELGGAASSETGALGRDYLVSLAGRQIAGGADWLDVNIDEVGGDVGLRAASMEWIVRVLEDSPGVTVPLALDSSSGAVREAGLGASVCPHGPLLINSASLERMDVMEYLSAYHAGDFAEVLA